MGTGASAVASLESIRPCQEPGCRYQASFILRTYAGQAAGRFCKRHALPALKRLQKEEDQLEPKDHGAHIRTLRDDRGA